MKKLVIFMALATSICCTSLSAAYWQSTKDALTKAYSFVKEKSDNAVKWISQLIHREKSTTGSPSK